MNERVRRRFVAVAVVCLAAAPALAGWREVVIWIGVHVIGADWRPPDPPPPPPPPPDPLPDSFGTTPRRIHDPPVMMTRLDQLEPK